MLQSSTCWCLLGFLCPLAWELPWTVPVTNRGWTAELMAYTAGMFRENQVQSAQSVCQVIAHPFHVFIYFLRGDQGVGHSCQWQSFGNTPEIRARVSPPDLVPCIALLWWDLRVQRSHVVVLAVSFCFKEVSFSCCPLTILLFHSTNFFISFLKCLHRGSLSNNK